MLKVRLAPTYNTSLPLKMSDGKLVYIQPKLVQELDIDRELVEKLTEKRIYVAQIESLLAQYNWPYRRFTTITKCCSTNFIEYNLLEIVNE